MQLRTILKNRKQISRQLLTAAGIIIMFFTPVVLQAQADSTKKTDTSTAAKPEAEEPSLLSPSIEFVSVQKGDSTVDLKAVLKTKYKGAFIKLPFLKLSFVAMQDTAEVPLGFVITDGMGKAVLNVKADKLVKDKEGKLNFKVIFAGNKAMDPAEESISVKRGMLVITPVKGDSTLSVTAKLVDLATGTETPVKETVIGVFIDRLFNPLKLGEGTTDETGETSVDVPNNLPGDAKGNITLLARLDENDVYGNMEAAVVQPWGLPVSDKNMEAPRALWSSHPPMWMLITFIILMGTVWGHYIVIVIQLFRLRKEEPHPADASAIV